MQALRLAVVRRASGLLVAIPRPRLVAADATCDVLAAWTWALICALALAAAILLPVMGISLKPGAFGSALACIATFVGFAVLLRLRGWVRLATGMSAACQLFALTILVPLASVALAATNLPLADAALDAFDGAFFANAWAFARVQIDHPLWMSVMNEAYASLTYQPLALVVLAAIFDPNQLARFALAWTLALCACLAIFPFLPALGFYLHHGIDPAAAQAVQVPAAWRHAEILLPARSGALRELGWEHINGIITFPSFHVAAAVLLAWGAMCLPAILRWPAILLNALMLVSTIVIGGHYLVDVAGGVIVAVAAMAASEGLARRSRAPAAPGPYAAPAHAGEAAGLSG